MTVSIIRDPISSGDIERLEQLYAFRNRATIVEFLEANSFLIPLLLEAQGKFAEYFPGAPLFLEFGCDPESTEEDCWITAYIATDLSVEDSLDVLDRLGTDWWLHDPMDRAQMRLTIDIESI